MGAIRKRHELRVALVDVTERDEDTEFSAAWPVVLESIQDPQDPGGQVTWRARVTIGADEYAGGYSEECRGPMIAACTALARWCGALQRPGDQGGGERPMMRYRERTVEEMRALVRRHDVTREMQELVAARKALEEGQEGLMSWSESGGRLTVGTLTVPLCQGGPTAAAVGSVIGYLKARVEEAQEELRSLPEVHDLIGGGVT